jgi:EamA domain-containing membrane protein RarD
MEVVKMQQPKNNLTKLKKVAVVVALIGVSSQAFAFGSDDITCGLQDY